MRLLTWNIAHGRGLARRQSTLSRDQIERDLEGIAAVLRRERPDVVALQEVDGPSTWSGGFDHLAWLAHAAEMPFRVFGEHYVLHFGRSRVTAGTALLSRHPFVSTRCEAFGSAWRDNKGWAAGKVRIRGQEIEVFSVHLDFLNPIVRVRQVRRLAASLQGPAILAGDLNSPSAGRGALAELTRISGLRLVGPEDATFPAHRPWLCLDRVLSAREVRSARVLDDRLSDHRAVVVDF